MKLFRNSLTFCFILKHKITLFQLLSFVLIRLSLAVIHTHSLSFFVTRCHTLSLVVTLCHFLYYPLSLVVPLVVTPCYSLYPSLSMAVIHYHSLYHSFSLVVTRCLFVNDHEALRIVLIYQVVRCYSDVDFKE